MSTPSTPCSASEGSRPGVTPQKYLSAGAAGGGAEAGGEEAIKVYLKVRPQTPHEVAANEPTAIRRATDRAIEIVPNMASYSCCERYHFDHVFDDAQQNADVYAKVVADLVHSLFRGVSSLLFAYGVTNAGKTYTVHGTETDAGILPHALEDVFAVLDAMQLSPESAPGALQAMLGCGPEDPTLAHLLAEHERGAKYSVVLSCLEVYNEKLGDLLAGDAGCGGSGSGTGTGAQRKELRMVEESGEINVTGLREVECPTAEEARAIVARARGRAQINATSLNGESSRSHSAFIVSLFRYTSAALNIGEVVGKLVVCDLAGSERTNRTKNTGARLKEAANINQSLVVLGRCLEALRWNQSHPANNRMVVPFRESKITRLFQSALTGSGGRTVMIVNVSPCAKDLDETVHALKYSSIAKEVTSAMGPPVKRKLQVRGDASPGGIATAIQSLSSQVEEFKTGAWRKECDIRRELGRLWGHGVEELQQLLSMQLITEVRAKESLASRKLAIQREYYEKRIQQLEDELKRKTTTKQQQQQLNAVPHAEGAIDAESWRTEHLRHLEGRVAELQSQLEEERHQRAIAQHEAQSLKAQLSQQSSSNSSAALGGLERQVAALRRERAEFEAQLLEAQGQLRQLEEQLQQESGERARLEREGSDSKKASRTAQQKAESLEKALRATENIQQNQQKTIDSLTRANQHGTNTINSQNAIIEQRKQELQNLCKQEQKLKEDLAQANQTNAMLSQLITQMKGQLQSAQDENAALRRKAGKPSSTGSLELQSGDPHPLAPSASAAASVTSSSGGSSAAELQQQQRLGGVVVSRRPSPSQTGGRKESPGRPPLRSTPRQQVEVHRIPMASPPPPVNTGTCMTLRKRSHSATTTAVSSSAAAASMGTPASRAKGTRGATRGPATPQPPAIELQTIAVDGMSSEPAETAAATTSSSSTTPAASSRVTPQPRRRTVKRLSSEFDAAQEEEEGSVSRPAKAEKRRRLLSASLCDSFLSPLGAAPRLRSSAGDAGTPLAKRLPQRAARPMSFRQV